MKGILLGVVAALGRQDPSGFADKSILSNWKELARVETLPNRLYNKRTSTTYYDEYWQTLCGSILHSLISLHDASQAIRTCNNDFYRSWYSSWWTWVWEFDSDEAKGDLVSSEYTGSSIINFHTSVGISTGLRRLFISSDEEWIGLAPMSAIAGDVIALLEGGPVPYILRPSETQAGNYELIGDAYVHGVMDGEGWNPDLLQEIVLV